MPDLCPPLIGQASKANVKRMYYFVFVNVLEHKYMFKPAPPLIDQTALESDFCVQVGPFSKLSDEML